MPFLQWHWLNTTKHYITADKYEKYECSGTIRYRQHDDVWRNLPQKQQKIDEDKKRATYLTLGQSSQTCCCIIWNRPGPSCIVFISCRQLHLRVPDVGFATGLYRTTCMCYNPVIYSRLPTYQSTPIKFHNTDTDSSNGHTWQLALIL